jgi:hypothetical protein
MLRQKRPAMTAIRQVTQTNIPHGVNRVREGICHHAEHAFTLVFVGIWIFFM